MTTDQQVCRGTPRGGSREDGQRALERLPMRLERLFLSGTSAGPECGRGHLGLFFVRLLLAFAL